MAIKHHLGRGLGALIQDGTTPAEASAKAHTGLLKVAIHRIKRSETQPRRKFDERAQAELADSIKTHGVLQPLLVRSAGADYELIAGERRFRAATQAGLDEVPVIVIAAADNKALELALVENLQREDLNAIEEAEAYQVLMDKFGLTQEEVAKNVGKARASVANALRLLVLPDEVKRLIVDGSLSAGHAKALIGLDAAHEQLLYAKRCVQEGLSVREIEKLVKNAARAPRKPRASRDDLPRDHLSYLSDKLHAHFGTAVRINSCRTYSNGKKARGSIEIEFYSNDDLDRILELLGIEAE